MWTPSAGESLGPFTCSSGSRLAGIAKVSSGHPGPLHLPGQERVRSPHQDYCSPDVAVPGCAAVQGPNVATWPFPV
jgi:hypothetical protein